ncbi:MAG: DUF2059 domain-containing protein [Xanthobacteraceae bacterium]|nr:DUF2059 domain-containing protein [Xanthobacteraceae bacterium]
MVTLAIRAVRAGAILVALFGFAAAAQAQAPTAAQVKLARQVVEISAASRVFEAAVPTVFNQVYGTYIQQNPDLSKEIAGVLQDLIPEFDKRKEEIAGIIAQTYATKFTEAELNDLIAFYNSPTGKKLITSGAEIGRDSYGKVQEWSGKLLQQLTERLKSEMKKKGHTI